MGASEPEGGNRVDEGQGCGRVAHRVGGDGGAAGRPSHQVRRGVDPQGLDQRPGVLGPVVQPAGGVDRGRVGPPERAHIGGDEQVPVGCVTPEVLVEAPGGQVPVDHHHGDAVGWAGSVIVGAEPAGGDRMGFHAWQQVHRSNSLGRALGWADLIKRSSGPRSISPRPARRSETDASVTGRPVRSRCRTGRRHGCRPARRPDVPGCPPPSIGRP